MISQTTNPGTNENEQFSGSYKTYEGMQQSKSNVEESSPKREEIVMLKARRVKVPFKLRPLSLSRQDEPVLVENSAESAIDQTIKAPNSRELEETKLTEIINNLNPTEKKSTWNWSFENKFSSAPGSQTSPQQLFDARSVQINQLPQQLPSSSDQTVYKTPELDHGEIRTLSAKRKRPISIVQLEKIPSESSLPIAEQTFSEQSDHLIREQHPIYTNTHSTGLSSQPSLSVNGPTTEQSTSRASKENVVGYIESPISVLSEPTVSTESLIINKPSLTQSRFQHLPFSPYRIQKSENYYAEYPKYAQTSSLLTPARVSSIIPKVSQSKQFGSSNSGI